MSGKLHCPLNPGSWIGILGGGQLGRMLAQAAARLGFRAHIFCPDHEAPASAISGAHTRASYDDEVALKRFAKAVDVVTLEFENIPARSVEIISHFCRMAPPLLALKIAQDRRDEKKFLTSLGIEIAPFCKIETRAQLQDAARKLSGPALLKTCQLGYDGKGQVKINSQNDLEPAWKKLKEQPSVLEDLIAFEHEISVIIVRTSSGDMAEYEPARNLHIHQILAESHVPSGLSPDILEKARSIAREIVSALDYVGVLAVEMFYCREQADHPLLVNEIAPRVHNSGHWTLDACQVSQFENHIRAICDWPLGGTDHHSDAVMTNLIGEDIHQWSAWASHADVSLHLYGKEEVREGRKMGHVTRLSRRST